VNTNTRTESLALAQAPQQVPMTISSNDLMLSDTKMDRIIRVAELMATGRSTVPKHLQGNVGDCMAVAMLATRWNMDPFAVAQKTHVVNGTLGYEAQLIAARINNSGIVSDRFQFEWYGDWSRVIGRFVEKESKRNPGEKYRAPGWSLADEKGLGVKVWATIRGESEPRVLDILLTQAGVRNSTLWADDPKQQLAYLAQKRWARLYAPDVILGAYDQDELMQAAPRDMGPVEEVSLWSRDQMTAADEAAAKGTKAYVAYWKGLGADMQAKLSGTPEHQAFKDQAQRADAIRTVDTPPPNPAPAPTAAPAADQQTGEIVTTAADVRSKLEAAKNEDALFVAMDWFNAVPQPEQDAARAEIEALFDARLKTLRGE
jgi:hypothetical protein